MEYTDAWFMKKGARSIESFTSDCIVADTNYLITYSHIYV